MKCVRIKSTAPPMSGSRKVQLAGNSLEQWSVVLVVALLMVGYVYRQDFATCMKIELVATVQEKCLRKSCRYDFRSDFRVPNPQSLNLCLFCWDWR